MTFAVASAMGIYFPKFQVALVDSLPKRGGRIIFAYAAFHPKHNRRPRLFRVGGSGETMLYPRG